MKTYSAFLCYVCAMLCYAFIFFAFLCYAFLCYALLCYANLQGGLRGIKLPLEGYFHNVRQHMISRFAEANHFTIG